MSKAFRDFARGVGQAFDMGGTLAPRRAPSTRKTQSAALFSYWRAVGDNIQYAMNTASSQERDRNDEQ